VKSARFFWRYLTCRADIGVALLLCSALVAAAELSIPWLIQRIIDNALGGDSQVDLDTWFLGILGILGAVYVLHMLLLRIEARMLQEASYHLRRRLYTHIYSQALPFFQRHKTGRLLHRVTSDAAIFEESAYEIFSDLPFSILTALGVLILMGLLDLRVMLLVVLFMAAMAVLTGYLGRPLPTIRKSIQRVGAGLSGRLQESLVGIHTVKAFQNEPHELHRLDKANRKILDAGLSEGKVEALLNPLFDLMEILGVVVVVWYGCHLLMDQELTPGGLVAFIAYMEILAGPVSHAGGYYRHFQNCRAVAERLQNLLDDQEPPLPSGSKRPTSNHWTVEVADVSFRYPNSRREALSQVSFRVEPGTSVAIVGANGTGKSTLLNLLGRFYDPGAGRVRVGAVDLKEWHLDTWRQAVGVMSQETFLFHGTVADNVAYAKLFAEPREIEAAVLAAGAQSLVDRLAAGLDTEVGELGSALSGGERQVIALARLILRNPHILLLDEPTTHLDGEARRRVISALERLMTGRTTFLVSHHAELTRLADRVLLLDNGRLVADSTHEALQAHSKLYRSLLAKQDRPRRARQRR
jgi:ABC-type multidrug transport system fused ATPase/permease subunit